MAIVLDYPTALEANRGRLLEGDTGKLIRQTCKALGHDPGELHIVTALNCKPAGAKPKLLKESMARCRTRLLRELRELGVRNVLCLGTIGYTALTSTDKIARMDKVHGRWVPAYGMMLMPTYSPTRVLIDNELFRDFYFAFDKFFNTEREPYPTVRMTVARTWSELQWWFEEFVVNDNVPVACDIETDGFNPFDDEVLAIGFAIYDSYDHSSEVCIVSKDFDAEHSVLDQRKTWEVIAEQLNNGTTSFHNARFDLKFITRRFIENGIEYDIEGRIDDTMLLNYCIDERPTGRYAVHNLKSVSRRHYDAPDYDIDMGKWLKEWRVANEKRKRKMLREMHTYLALDCYYTARLAHDLTDKVRAESEKLYDLYNWLLMPGTLALTEIELYGCKMDRPYLEQLHEELLEQLDVSLTNIQLMTGIDDFNPNSAPQVHKLLYDTLDMPVTKTERKGKLQEGPTSQPVMRILRGRYPENREIIDAILNYRRLKKIMGTYVVGLLERLDGDDRIRCNYRLNGTVTGRLSSSDPNLQNIPEKSHVGFDLRAAFIPSKPGWLLIESDYSQLELRVAAHLSQDENFISTYVEGRDLHKEVCDAIYLRDNVTPYERWLAKNTVFGALYGRGANSLANGPEMEYVKNELGGTPWTLEETETFFKRFFANYPDFRKWQLNQKALVYKYQYIESPLGRIRRFPFIGRNDNGAAGRQAMNTPIQSTASDITFSALIQIHRRIKELNKEVGRVVAHVVLTVHDSVTTESHPKYVKQVTRIVREEMQKLPLESNVPFAAKIDTGVNWGACK